MPDFIFEGKARGGKLVKGELTAESRDDLYKQLRGKGIIVTKVKKKPMQLSIQIGTGVKNEDITNFARQFSAMVSAGLPLIQCLNILSEQTENTNFKKILLTVTTSVESGNSLAESLAKHPKVFPELFVNMIAAGEIGGILDVILLRLATFLEKAAALNRKIKGAMMYPLIITLVMIGAVSILMIFVIPVFTKMFTDSGAELPMPTQIVVGISDFMSTPVKIIPVVMGIAAFFFAFAKYRDSPKGHLVTDKIALKIPALGNLIKKSAIAQFARTLGTLLSSGVSIIESLEITARTASNMVVRNALRSMISAISEGKTMTEPMKATGIFPPMVVQMVAVGEESGGLDQMLTKIADFYDEEVNAAVETLTSMMEPLIIVILAVVLGGILVAMYMPMFGMIDAVQG